MKFPWSYGAYVLEQRYDWSEKDAEALSFYCFLGIHRKFNVQVFTWGQVKITYFCGVYFSTFA